MHHQAWPLLSLCSGSRQDSFCRQVPWAHSLGCRHPSLFVRLPELCNPHSQFSQHLAAVCAQRTHTVVLNLVIQAIKPQAKLLNPDPGRQPKGPRLPCICTAAVPICGGLGVAYPSRRQGQYNLLGHNCLKEQPSRLSVYAKMLLYWVFSVFSALC